MREMTKARMDIWLQDRPHMIHGKQDLIIDKDEVNIKGRLRDRSKRTEDYKSSKGSQSMYRTEDILETKHLNTDDLSSWNGKIVLPQNETVKPVIVERSSIENLNAAVRVRLHKPKRRQNINTLSKSKRPALTMNAANSWEIKYNPILKAEASRNAKNLKVCLKKIALYDRNANVISVCDKFKRSGINNLKQKTEDKVVSSINLGAGSKHGAKNENFEQFKRTLKRFSTTLTLVPKRIDNGTAKAQISDTTGNQSVKEESTVLEANSKQDLLLKEEAKDRDTVLNRNPCENVGKTKKMPVIIETTVLPINTIKISDVGQSISGPKIVIKSSPEFNTSKCKSHNTHTEINMAELLNIVEDNEFKKNYEKGADNSVVKVKDSVKKNCANAEANSDKKDSSTVESTAWKDRFSTKISDEAYNVKFSSEYSSIRGNKTTAFPARALPPRDCTTDTTVDTNRRSRNVCTSAWMNTGSSLSSNNALKRRAEHSTLDRQEIISTKEETEKISTKVEDLDKKVNLSKDTRANSNQSIENEGTKRIKLSRSVCLKNFGRKCENDGVCDNAGSVIASTAGTVPQMVMAGSSKPTIVAHVPETKSKNEEGALNLVEEKASTSFGSTNKEDTDSLQNVWKPSKETSETPKSPAKQKFEVAGNRNCDSETSMDDEDNDTDTDCISLYADSTLMAEYDSPVISAQSNSRKQLGHGEKPYAMTDIVFKNYYESTTSEFNKVYDTINANNVQNTSLKADRIPVALRLGMPVAKAIAPLMSRVHKNRYNCGTANVARPYIPKWFRGYCYKYIKTGNCSMEVCKYRHDFLTCMNKLYVDGDRCLFKVLDNLASMGFFSFLCNIYKQLVMLPNTDTILVLKVLKRLYELAFANSNIAEWTILVWQRMNISTETVINNLARIVDHNDSKFVNWIVKILQDHIIHHIIYGTYWNTLRALLLQVPNLEPEIVTIIIRECVTTGKNVDDVHRNVVIKLDNNVRSMVDHRLWFRFNNLLKCTRENNTIQEIWSSQSHIHVRSPDVNNPVVEAECTLTTSQYSMAIVPKVWTECSPKTKERDDNNNAQNESPVLHPIDDLPEPQSPHGRRIFWKFYLDVQSLQEGLKHDDYDRVTRILNAAKPTDKTVFSRECYKILHKEVKYSQSRLSKLISFAGNDLFTETS